MGWELACWGDHFDVRKAASSDKYCRDKWDTLEKYGLKCWSISNHLAGQAVCDLIDDRHEAILPPKIFGNGKPEQVRRRAAKDMTVAAEAAKAFGVKVVNGFTGSSIWHLAYSFPARRSVGHRCRIPGLCGSLEPHPRRVQSKPYPVRLGSTSDRDRL